MDSYSQSDLPVMPKEPSPPNTGADVVQVLLPVVIYTAGPISGAHFNPMVTSVFMMARMQVLLFSLL